MSSLNIESIREEFPGKSDEQIAEALAKKDHCLAVLRYKKKDARDFTKFALCWIADDINAYFESPYCRDVQVLYNGRPSAHYCPGCGQRIHAGLITIWPGGDIPDDYRCAGCSSAIDDIVRIIVREADEESIREMEERGKREIERVAAGVRERYGSLAEVDSES